MGHKDYLKKITEEGWNVAFRKKKDKLILDDQETPFTLIPNTWRTWEADPFLFEYKGETYIFAEIFDFITRRGSIGYTSYRNGKWSRWKKVISEEFHLSYPNIFIYNNDIYMIPESSADASLRLYRAVLFPDKWELVRKMADGVQWVDTTFGYENDRRFAITRDVSNWEQQSDLRLDLSDMLDIIKIEQICESNIEHSRLGGNLFNYSDAKIRVTQDCSSHYGGALIFSKFDDRNLVERGMGLPILYLKPDDLRFSKEKKWCGLHTYNLSENYEVVDVESRKFNLWGLLVRFLGKIKQL